MISEAITSKRSQPKDDELWHQAIAFTSDRRRRNIITKIARKFMVFSPYEVEDYLSEAAAVAFEALKTSEAKNDLERWEGYFWTLLKAAFSRLSTNPSQQEVVPGEDAGRLAVTFEEYSEEWDDDNGKPPTAASSMKTPLDRLVKQENLESLALRQGLDSAMKKMTEREQEIWKLILDGKSSQEIAEKTGTSRQNVEKIRGRAIQRAGKGASVVRGVK
jgi:RNA polymerase sigma factor (sigma-70 family)